MNDQNRRLYLTVALCMGLYLGWMYFFGPKPKAPGQAGTAAVASATSTPVAAPPASAASAATGSPVPGAADVPRETAAVPRPPSKTVGLRSGKLAVTLSSDGGVLSSVKLLAPKFQKVKGKGEAPTPVDLVSGPARPLPLAVQLTGADGRVLVPFDAGYEVSEESGAGATLVAKGPGVVLTRKLQLDAKTYNLAQQFEVKGDGALEGKLTVLLTGWADPNVGSGYFSARSDPTQALCQSGGKTERITRKDDGAKWEGPGNAVFAGISEQYFLAALVPEAGKATCRVEADGKGWLKASVEVPVKAAAGAAWTSGVGTYLGPKDTEELGAVAPALKESVDFGFWAVIANFLLLVMKFFYTVLPWHNWGLAIILLTVTAKIATFPLQWKSMKSMQEMQRIQPEIEALKKRLGSDTQRFNEEQMKLFKEHGVNPMGGCLPMLIQLPLWFALYTTLRVSVELYNSMFIPGWLNDLTSMDPYFILPVAMGATMLLTQILTPQPMSNPSQKTIGYVMTGVFSIMMVNLPSGLTLYIFTNNILSIVMQMYLKRTMKPLAAGGAA
jgi:YidC/Oxa1 family membrane protein insertase